MSLPAVTNPADSAVAASTSRNSGSMTLCIGRTAGFSGGFGTFGPEHCESFHKGRPKKSPAFGAEHAPGNVSLAQRRVKHGGASYEKAAARG